MAQAVLAGSIGGIYINDTTNNQTILPGVFINGTGAPSAITTISWLVDEKPQATVRQKTNLDQAPDGIALPPVVVAPVLSWLVSEKPQVISLRTVSLDQAAVGGFLSPVAVVVSVSSWLVDEFPPPRRKRPVYLSGDDWSVILPIPPPNTGWLESGVQRPLNRRLPARFDDTTFVARHSAIFHGWMSADEPVRIRRPALYFDGNATGAALPPVIPPPPLPNIGWLEPGAQRIIIRRPALYFDVDAVRGAIPSVPAPSLIGWLVDGITRRNYIPAKLAGNTSWAVVLPLIQPPLGWLEADEPVRIVRRSPAFFGDAIIAGGVPPIPPPPLVFIEGPAIIRRPALYFDKSVVGGMLPPRTLAHFVDPDFVVQYPQPIRMVVAGMPRALNDFSPIYTTEQVPISFDFTKALVSGETLSSSSVSINLVIGLDSSPSSRLIGAPSIIGSFIVQWVGALQPGATYNFIATVMTSLGEILTTNAHQSCPKIE